jgi:RNA polymerase sigma-70 factor (ECF subfamily)
MQYSQGVDTASNPGDLILPAALGHASTVELDAGLCLPDLPSMLLEELWEKAEAGSCGLTAGEFQLALTSVGAKANHGLPAGGEPAPSQKAAFFRSLHLSELALAHGCALGREMAWERFLGLYRSSLVQAAIGITGSATLGEELADSLYAELYGLRQVEGQRRSPLSSYSGRGSLLGWLRTTLVQRFRDHYRRTYRETPLDDFDSPAPAPTAAPPIETTVLARAVGRTLEALDPEDRFLLVAYYLDRQTLLEISRTINVHEATVSRRVKRLLAGLRNRLIRNLVSCGLTRAAALEALGTDPRDMEINLRALLQTSQRFSFQDHRAAAPTD